ncbi:MAG: hypothetical protein KZQ60_18735 [Candidatus Thiodiazotropha sp. (ex Lucinoma aequizonata)]|nr:hypothetical protein [Candidatus Thiodiazotropha sp. (ex Lucinoma aequizonata)]MCU7913650.1 hypothetical protein [Candidatus Thiodiazotropha sp. (ex Lucinoma aequizonata)]
MKHSGRDFRLEREGIDLGGQFHLDMSECIFLHATGTGSVTIEIAGTLRNGTEDKKVINYPLDTLYPGQPIEVIGLYHKLRVFNHDVMDFRLSGYKIIYHDMGEW